MIQASFRVDGIPEDEVVMGAAQFCEYSEKIHPYTLKKWTLQCVNYIFKSMPRRRFLQERKGGSTEGKHKPGQGTSDSQCNVIQETKSYDFLQLLTMKGLFLALGEAEAREPQV